MIANLLTAVRPSVDEMKDLLVLLGPQSPRGWTLLDLRTQDLDPGPTASWPSWSARQPNAVHANVPIGSECDVPTIHAHSTLPRGTLPRGTLSRPHAKHTPADDLWDSASLPLGRRWE
ncbi:unnamed protein product [Merluccius merluccius]